MEPVGEVEDQRRDDHDDHDEKRCTHTILGQVSGSGARPRTDAGRAQNPDRTETAWDHSYPRPSASNREIPTVHRLFIWCVRGARPLSGRHGGPWAVR